MRRLIALLPLTGALFALTSGACSSDQTPFNEIDRLRVLGLRATRPWLLSGQTATIDFLAVNGDPQLQGANIASRWYLCPVQGDSTLGFQCLVNSPESIELIFGAELAAAFTGAEVGEFGLLLSEDDSVDIPFDGTLISAELINSLCETLTGAPEDEQPELPPFFTVPECMGRFPITIYLEHGVELDDGTIDPANRVVAFRDLDLVYNQSLEPNPPNQNPQIDGVNIWVAGESAPQPLDPNAVQPLRFDRTYQLSINVDLEQSEIFDPMDDDEPNRESLIVTWFIEGGETDSGRTGYLPQDDGESLADLVTNDWTTPTRQEWEERWGDRRDLRLLLVIRDNRGGLEWVERRFELNDRTGL